MANTFFDSFKSFVEENLGDIVVDLDYFDKSQKIWSYGYIWFNSESGRSFEELKAEIDDFWPSKYEYETKDGTVVFTVDRTKQLKLLYDEARRIKNSAV